uniref:Cadherin domain-containing protein n=1 Tax=Salarias fasciatus TaxID=181472 RepID=A0A672G479_SALFA
MSQPIGPGFLKRSKRRWSPPPFNILENYSGSLPKGIERIVSDTQQNYSVYYTISGPGVDQHPIGLFSLNSKTGLLTVHKAIDREEFPSFKVNPQTSLGLVFFILAECGREVVGLVNATDRDLAGSLHTKIHFSLLSGQDLFGIHPETGVITTKTNTLDRETKDTHVVTVQIKDMAGADSGLSSQGQATIRLSDINDNPPTFNKTSYDASIQENDKDKLILRIPVKDKDLINTPNWVSKFVISKGNENGNFKIETDPKTNDGLLYVTKPLDYEKNKNVNLEIRAENQAKLSGTTAQWMSVPINVAVTDVDEGPEFTAPTVRYTVKENIANGTLIGTYSAVDPETKSSDGILYYKDSDPAGWINMDRTSGALRVANTIDRESHFVKNGMYNMTVKAVDSSSKTGSGTVIIVVEDMNDNMPTFPPGELILCEKEGEMGSVLLVAEDKDLSPYSAPFTFSIPSDSDGKWTVTRFNDTAATLQHVKELPTGMHEVPVLVKDLQGHGEVQTAMVRICECRGGVCLDKNRSAMFGGMGVLAMLLPLLLLLLLGEYLSSCPACRTREKIQLDDAADSGGILLKSNTEAPGDEVDSSLINVPMIGTETVKGGVKSALPNMGWMGDKSASTIGGQSVHENGFYKTGYSTTNMQEFHSSQYDGQQFGAQTLGTGMNFDYRNMAQDSAFMHTWRTNGLYLRQKLGYLGTEQDGRFAEDYSKAYGFEGVGSTAGSVGCCSDFGGDDNLEFLNALGPKFNTLADVCRKS